MDDEFKLIVAETRCDNTAEALRLRRLQQEFAQHRALTLDIENEPVV